MFNKKLKEEIKELKGKIKFGQETINILNRKLDDKTRDARRIYAENNDLKALIKTLKQKNTRLNNKLKTKEDDK